METSVKASYLQNTLSSAPGAGRKVLQNCFLILEEFNLNERPWMQFSSNLGRLPDPVRIEPESKSLLVKKRPYWLPKVEDSVLYGFDIENVDRLEIVGAEMKVKKDNI